MPWLLRLAVVLGAAPGGAAALFVWFAARGELKFAAPTLIVAVPVLALWLFSLYALLRSGLSARNGLDLLLCAVAALFFFGAVGILHGVAVYE